jgi:hypothetical protein
MCKVLRNPLNGTGGFKFTVQRMEDITALIRESLTKLVTIHRCGCGNGRCPASDLSLSDIDLSLYVEGSSKRVAELVHGHSLGRRATALTGPEMLGLMSIHWIRPMWSQRWIHDTHWVPGMIGPPAKSRNGNSILGRAPLSCPRTIPVRNRTTRRPNSAARSASVSLARQGFYKQTSGKDLTFHAEPFADIGPASIAIGASARLMMASAPSRQCSQAPASWPFHSTTVTVESTDRRASILLVRRKILCPP